MTELLTRGSIDLVERLDDRVRIHGWSAAFEPFEVLGARIEVAGRDREIIGLQIEDTPDIAEWLPYLSGIERCRFIADVRVPPCEREGGAQASVRLVFQGGGGNGMPVHHVVEPAVLFPGEDVVGAVGGGTLTGLEFLRYLVGLAGARTIHEHLLDPQMDLRGQRWSFDSDPQREEYSASGLNRRFALPRRPIHVLATVFMNTLGTHDTVLDIGCGLGRMALSLAYYLGDRGRYIGFDIVPEIIAWATEHLVPEFADLAFHRVDVRNGMYNSDGLEDPLGVTFPAESEQVDVAFIASVFTHMLDDEVCHYLDEIARVLRPGGRGLVSRFLLDPTARALMAEGRSDRVFAHALGRAFVLWPDEPEQAVAYEETLFRGWYEARGLRLEGRLHGFWSGRAPALTYQDLLVLTRLRR